MWEERENACGWKHRLSQNTDYGGVAVIASCHDCGGQRLRGGVTGDQLT